MLQKFTNFYLQWCLSNSFLIKLLVQLHHMCIHPYSWRLEELDDRPRSSSVAKLDKFRIRLGHQVTNSFFFFNNLDSNFIVSFISRKALSAYGIQLFKSLVYLYAGKYYLNVLAAIFDLSVIFGSIMFNVFWSCNHTFLIESKL